MAQQGELLWRRVLVFLFLSAMVLLSIIWYLLETTLSPTTQLVGVSRLSKVKKSHTFKPFVHRLSTRYAMRNYSHNWTNELAVTETNHTSEGRRNESEWSLAVIQQFLRTNDNEAAAAELRTTIAEKIPECGALQIYRGQVPPGSIYMEDSVYMAKKRNQTDCVTLKDSCALVGNSGILLGSECGNVIDAADFVIRNNLPSLDRKYAKDIGTVTDVMTVNLELIRSLIKCLVVKSSKWWITKQKCEVVTKMMDFFDEGDVIWFIKRIRSQFKDFKSLLSVLKVKYKLDFRLAYSPVMPMEAASELAGVPMPSSGLAAFVASTQFCRSLNLFGFYPFNTAPGNRKVPTHYFDKSRTGFSKVHEIPVEFQLLMDWDKQGAIRIINDCRHQ